ncbi:flagellar hook-length control protein FliK [Burkholderia vietnamiensis]|nr:flagellar hook-length control protein FliK [Burkholderia vietnamiensis]
MTESVSLPRPRSRSRHSPARSRLRSAAAAADNAANASARPRNAPAGDASRDERTLDLFGDPVFEPAARAAAVARDDTLADAQPAAATPDTEDAGRQASLDGFGTPGATAMRDGDVAVPTGSESAPAAGHGAAREAVVVRTFDADATKVTDLQQPAGAGAGAMGEPASGDAQAKAGGMPETAGDAETAAGLATASAIAVAGAARDARPAKPGSDAEAGGAPAKHDQAARTPGEASKARRAASGGKRRVAHGAREAAASGGTARADAVAANAEPASVSASATTDYAAQSTERKASVEPAAGVDLTAAAITTTAGHPTHTAAPTSPTAQPVTSAASFVTKPSSDRAQPAGPGSAALDPDTDLRPLADRLATLQTDTAGIKQAADREMRRVNRLLLALAVVVFAGLVALVLQTRQIAQLKQELDSRQLRIDRLAADLSTQQATLMTLAEHHEALLSQVDRLQRNANREAAVAKRARRAR